MRHYDIKHSNGTDSLPDYNALMVQARREQARAVRAAFAGIAARLRRLASPRGDHAGRGCPQAL